MIRFFTLPRIISQTTSILSYEKAMLFMYDRCRQCQNKEVMLAELLYEVFYRFISAAAIS